LIGTDGSVQALDVVSGDPLFINSAKEAVFAMALPVDIS
jgi:hypothetical protein